ncbi:MAG: (Fe-S)-binding protein [Aigarchaeota archaeon]|nr:(Fe-S)-binding protein [Aigarchaeota archaeon]MCX8193294.1 (Fe-S)-binding protein [Nitrososphaeria archaeon]MDW7986513.1 (Fe-S)-binding protein [Nitrososphaerota archaeon]
MSKALLVNIELMEKMAQLTSNVADYCYQCGTCTASCPFNILKPDTLNPRKIVRRALLGLPYDDGSLWLCSTCGLCEVKCPWSIRIPEVVRGYRQLASESRKIPQKLEEILWMIYEDGTAFPGSSIERTVWTEGLKIKDASREKVKVLLYIGCAVSFDKRLQKIAKSLVNILSKVGVDFGILGREEKCCGDVVYNIGEDAFLEELATQNIERFNKTGAEVIIAISPHSAHMFKRIYPKYGLKIPSQHYIEFIADLIEKDKIRLEKPVDGLVTIHDPCYLGRYLKIYDEPRKILSSIPGLEIIEMKDNKENAVCCGSGGGRHFLEVHGERLSHYRVMEAAETGAKIMVAPCPFCIQNFEDSVKVKRLDINVKDIIELVNLSVS